jgi:hypothetical protein
VIREEKERSIGLREVKIIIFEKIMSSSAVRALALEYKGLLDEPVEGFRVKLVSDDNLFEWSVSSSYAFPFSVTHLLCDKKMNVVGKYLFFN